MDVDDSSRLRRVIGKLARQFNSTSTDEGLTPSQASVLGLVAFRGEIALPELVDVEGINPTMLSRVVGKLDERGLIRRVADPADLRSAHISITGAGREVDARIKSERAALIASCASRLPATQVEQLLRALPALEALAEELKTAALNPW